MKSKNTLPAFLSVILLFTACNQSGQPAAETATSESAQPATNNPIALIVSHHVKDFIGWRAMYDMHEKARAAAQLKEKAIYRDAADTNYVSIFFQAGSIDDAKKFIQSEDLKNAMSRAGVLDEPEFKFYELITSNESDEGSGSRQFVIGKVQDFDTFKSVFDEREPARQEKGISTVIIARNLDAPNEIAIALTAPDISVLKSYFEEPAVKDAMARAGFEGTPEIMYALKTARVLPAN